MRIPTWLRVAFPFAIVGVFMAVGALVPSVDDASGGKTFTLEDIRATAELRRDGVLLVRERVTYDFDGSFSVGTRDFDSGPWIIDRVRVTEDGRPRTVITDTPTLIEWNLGVGTVSGTHTYVLEYQVHHAVLAWPDVVELYWQWVGDSAPGVEHHELTLRVPGNGEGLRAWAHGPLNGEISIDGPEVHTTVDDLPANTFLETRVAVNRSAFDPSLPPARQGDTSQGFVGTCDLVRAQLEDSVARGEPIDVDQGLRTAGCPPRPPVETEPQLDRIVAEETALADAANAERARVAKEEADQADRRRILNLMFPLVIGVAALAAYVIWRRWGKEPELALEVDYWREVPDDPPAVAQALMQWGAVDTDAFSVTIVDLAQRGYLRIEEIPDQRDFRFTRTDKPADDLIEFERTALNRVFVGGNGSRTQKEIIQEAKASRTSSAQWMQSFKSKVLASYRGRGYQVRGQVAGWLLYLLVVALLGLYGLFAIRDEAFVAGFGAFGLAVVLLGFMVLLRRRTPKGAQRHAEWDGLRRFLKDFSQLEDAPVGHLALYERYLVAAVALDVADELVEALEVRFPEVANDPTFASWYVGTQAHSFTSLGDFNSGFSGAAASSFRAPSSSSSSGGGFGGGFSGGGGGGGGGGGFGAR